MATPNPKLLHSSLNYKAHSPQTPPLHFSSTQYPKINLTHQSQKKYIPSNELLLEQKIQRSQQPYQSTSKFRTHKKAYSYASSYSSESTQKKKWFPNLVEPQYHQGYNSDTNDFFYYSKSASLQFSEKEDDKSRIKNWERGQKGSLPKKRQNYEYKKTEKHSRKKEKAQLIQKLEKKLESLQTIMDKISLININSDSDKLLQSKYSLKKMEKRMESNPENDSNEQFKIRRKSLKLNDFILLVRKGKGKYGEVTLAVHRFSGAVVALKSQKKSQLQKNNMIENLILEVKIQSFLNHPNICKLYGIFDHEEYIYLVMEYLQDGSLYTSMKIHRSFSEQQASEKLLCISSAVSQLHKNSIIHRDIKPQNVVLNFGVCKLCDFGWSVVESGRRQTYCGTFDYVPPQILKGEKYNYSIDLWELGVLAYEIITGQLPFYHMSRKQTYLKITNFENKLLFPLKTSKEAINYICQLLRKKPEERRPINELLNHPFLKKYKEDIY